MTNGIVICADTFRADHLGAYGNTWIQTPVLDRLAQEGVVFEEFFAEALPTTARWSVSWWSAWRRTWPRHRRPAQMRRILPADSQ